MSSINEIIEQLRSYPTPDGADASEWMNQDFLKLHQKQGSVIHYFKWSSDIDYHTHPAAFTTHIIMGGYREEVLVPTDNPKMFDVLVFTRKPGTSHHMPVNLPHRLLGLPDGPCITRAEFGPDVQRSGFCRFRKDGTLEHRYWDEQEWYPYPRQ